MKDLFFQLMVAELKGEKFNNYGLERLAETQFGEVKESKQYLLLTERLYTPTAMEKFAAQ
jgi:hypothetical protein